jgi:hypothetical protein
MANAQPAMARRMINAAICAYQIHPAGWIPSGLVPLEAHRVQGPGNLFFYDVVPEYQDEVGFVKSAAQGYVPLFTSSGQDDINAALVGAMKDGNLLISIRGTIPPTLLNHDIFAWMHDWAQDGEIQRRDWSIKRGPWSNVQQVERGFAAAMLNLWPRLIQMIDATLAQTKCSGVVIAGHSKGAAMTFLAASLVAQAYPRFAGKIQVHAFAPPPFCNFGFQQAYAAIAPTTHRYQVENDVVPFLPLWDDADLYAAVTFSRIGYELAWLGFFAFIGAETGGGYETVGDFTYFNRKHQLVPGADVLTSALPAVAATLMAEDFETVADAHSAVNSYRPCFM